MFKAFHQCRAPLTCLLEEPEASAGIQTHVGRPDSRLAWNGKGAWPVCALHEPGTTSRIIVSGPFFRWLGNGAFGEVSLAEINHPAFTQNKAAVKTVKKGVPEHLGLEEKFLVEGTISIPLDHPNVVRTLGWCYDSKPLQLLMELCPGGALSTFLMAKSEKASNLTLTRFCLDAARGLEYLHDVGVLHRDVAARNCLIDEHGTAKVADFGLSVKAYYYEMTTAENLPTRYLPPESLTSYSFKAESDVYAYGHLVCEVFNKCQMPYAGMSGPEARKQILAGKVVNVHERAPEALRFFVENRIFAYHAIYRPTMPQIVEFMTEVISILKEANPGDNAAFEIGAENKEAMQPSTGTEVNLCLVY
ncbi:unnamed protein product [Caenorhabditis auriculariae]|uniref:Protein kinase domain-containing protein n=1 Tax=Caenorhabditis auriculariae TaxID=2777116 RepID=A0A8S1H881_9PELO|nr:unnamed protein product [Caenorhabditis auriculariae]